MTEDGGKTFGNVPIDTKHVDDHAIWIDPDDTDHLLVGCDGGIYETWQRGATWDFKANLPCDPVLQDRLDNAWPFYNVYGGTQDNNTIGGPTRTTTVHGIRNMIGSSPWAATVSTRVDPDNPDISTASASTEDSCYAGGMARPGYPAAARAGRAAPQVELGLTALISPHSGSRLYFGGQRLFRSDDRGKLWVGYSGDLTRGIDRNQLEVMGRVWSVDAVWKNVFTSFYGNFVALDESPLAEGLLYVGSDDGLVHVTANGGEDWTTAEKFPGVPERTYVADLTASRHDVDTVYAAFNNHKSGDFTPYLLKSQDRGRRGGPLPASAGRTWCGLWWKTTSTPALLFVGTEFGLFFTVDGGKNVGPLDRRRPDDPCSGSGDSASRERPGGRDVWPGDS